MERETPVVILTFNRPDLTERLMQVVTAAQPKKLFLVSDGPRDEHASDILKVDESRRILEREMPNVEVVHMFSEKNQGCRLRVQSALNEIFSLVDRAIILEDDCIPTVDFFRYSGELLERYKDDCSVGTICGTNLRPSKLRWPDSRTRISSKPRPEVSSYLFSKIFFPWGWASWARTWKLYDADATIWSQKAVRDMVFDQFSTKRERMFWDQKFTWVQNGFSTWDYQLVLTHLANNLLVAVPSANLISNVGQRPDATHTTNISWDANLPTGELATPLVHPSSVQRSARYDSKLAKIHPRTLPGRLADRLRAMRSRR